jgi:hypothetical protein
VYAYALFFARLVFIKFARSLQLASADELPSSMHHHISQSPATRGSLSLLGPVDIAIGGVAVDTRSNQQSSGTVQRTKTLGIKRLVHDNSLHTESMHG